jgi:hypothetical protein
MQPDTVAGHGGANCLLVFQTRKFVYEQQVIVNSENLSAAKKPHSVVSRAAADLGTVDNSRSEINNLMGLTVQQNAAANLRLATS